ncbi:MAG: hypothetical protein UC451_06090 [Faecalibacterium sp.]|nr:hypothetical protein [Faecalibacterium sp.]
MRKINKLGRRAAALVLAVGLTLSTAAPVLAADADEVQTPAAQTEQQETDTEADEADVDTEADEAAALPELSEDREVAEEDEAVALPELSEDREVAEGDEAAADEAALLKGHKHKWKKEKTVAPTCTEQGYTLYKCEYNLFGIGCTATKKDDYVPALGHDMSDWIVVEATCTTAGEKYQACKRSGCNHKVVEEGYAEAHPALGHDFEGAEWVVEAPTCTTPGKRYQVCKRDGCNAENVDETYAKEHPALGHAWGKYVDDDKPGCQQQTETAHCTREGCTATDTEDRANFGPGGNPLPHKYTTYKGLDEILGVPTKYKSTCDYGCGTTKEFGALDKDVVVDKTTQGAMDTVKVDDMTADERANQIIDDALKAAQEAVKQAKTKKEAIAALDQISATVKSELSSMKISVGKLNKDVSIDPKDLENILKPLDTTIDSLKGSLDDSFLSQETITSLVNKLATDVPASTAPETGIKKLIYNTVYDAIYNLTAKDDEKKTTDSMPDVKNMVLQLVSDVAKSDEGWNTMTDALVDDAVELALDEVMKDKTYAMLLKTKLGASTVEEVRAEVKKQLVNDPTFMNSVRAQVQKAADEASKGVSQGWSDQKVLDRLQANLLPISGLVANKIDELGSSAGNIADNKVDDTVHKFLPGKLGDWVSDKVGNKVNNIVQNKVNDLGGQVTDLIDSFIKQFTCGKHEYGDFEILKNPTCTEKGQKGKICKKCGKITEKTDIDAAGHTPVTDPAVAPTETTDGLTEGSHCGVCGAVLQAQEVIPMLDPTIDTWFSRAATTEADAKAAGFDSVDAANAALDAALTAAGFDPANAEHFTVQVNSSIGVLPNDRYPEDGVTCKLTLPQATKGQMAQEYYLVQMCTADGRFRKAGDIIVTPVRMDTYEKNGLKFTAYSQSIVALAWKPLY